MVVCIFISKALHEWLKAVVQILDVEFEVFDLAYIICIRVLFDR